MSHQEDPLNSDTDEPLQPQTRSAVNTDGDRTTAPRSKIPPIYTNQQVINAFFYAAKSLGQEDWSLLEKAGLDVHVLAADRTGIYTGESVDRLPTLNPVVQSLVHRELIAQLLEQVRWVGLVSARDGLNLRSGPANDQPVILALPYQTVVQVIDDSQPWLFVAAEGKVGYVHGDYVQRRTETPLASTGHSSNLLNVWRRYEDLLVALADRLGIDPAVALAVLMAESGGRAFGPDGRMIIRFETHVFFNEWGKQNPEQFARHFRFDPDVPWQTEGQRWSRQGDGAWSGFHGNQQAEWEVFEFARHLNEPAAMRSISMGAPQIMGFNANILGYESARQMFEAFQASERNQIEGLFRFIEGKELVDALRRRDFLAFARGYTGPGQAPLYRDIISRYVDEFNQAVAALPADRGLEPMVSIRSPLPLTIEQTGGKPLAEFDPQLYAAWRKHIESGFENNNEMFHRILNGFMNPYYTTIWMYRILFAVGILAFVAAGVLAYLLRDNPTTALGSAAIFGGLSVVSFLSYFVSRPLQALEENLHFITWLGIVYNTYWTRLAYATDQSTFQQDMEAATDTAIREIERLIDKHAVMSGKRPNAG
jgi:hypothetical protein